MLSFCAPSDISLEIFIVYHFGYFTKCLMCLNTLCANCLMFLFFSLGLITTTSRKLDREQQTEHILEVRKICAYMLVCLC